MTVHERAHKRRSRMTNMGGAGGPGLRFTINALPPGVFDVVNKNNLSPRHSVEVDGDDRGSDEVAAATESAGLASKGAKLSFVDEDDPALSDSHFAGGRTTMT